MKNSEKKEQPSFFEELGCFMKPYQKEYAASVIISVLSVSAGLLSYAFAGWIAGALFTNGSSFICVLQFVLGVVVCKILHTVLLNLSTWISHKAAYKTLRDIRLAVTDKMLALPQGYFEQNGTGRIKTMLVDHIETMEKTLAHMLPELTANLLGPMALMVWMFFIDWRIALMVLVWICIGFSVTVGMMKGYDEKFSGQIRALKNMNQSVVEFVNGIEVIKNFGKDDECYEKYEKAVYNHAEYNINWMKETQKYSSLGMAIAPFSVFAVLIGGIILYAAGSIEAGKVFLLVIVSYGIFTPIMNAMTYFDQLAGMGTNAKEIKNILDFPELKRGESAEGKHFDIEFRNVDFSYPNQQNKAVSNANFKVQEGSMFALVGMSGSGKSTIAKLLAGFWDIDKGEILIGGKNIQSYSQNQINSMIAYVDQETFLFDETIMDNIRIGKPDATDEQVIEVSKRAGCDDFIKNLEKGYFTMAGEAGNKLSGGEKQRIAIARAMMKDSPIMILDEATASSDPENEDRIQRALLQAAKGKTLIVIAHRLSTIIHADQIAFVKNGQITHISKHTQLLENCEDYRNMYNIQEGEK